MDNKKKPKEKWSKNAILAINQGPGEPHPARRHEEINRETTEFQAQEKVRKKFYMRNENLEKYGKTIGCPRCDTRGVSGMKQKPHTKECRDRIKKTWRQMTTYDDEVKNRQIAKEIRVIVKQPREVD